MPEATAPTCGRIVHYIVPAGLTMGECRPLIVTSVAGEKVSGHVLFEPRDHEHGLAALRRFGELSYLPAGAMDIYVQNIEPGAGTPGTWHWPERV